MSAIYIWSQVLTVIEYGLLGLSYLAKNRKLVVILDIFSMTMGIIAFLLLGADLGMGMSVVVLLANFYYLYEERKYGEQRKIFLRDYVALALVLAAIIAITILTYDGWLSLLSVAATVLYEISIWQKSTKVYKFLGIPVAFCWMTYNGFVRSIFGVICEMAMFITAIIGFVKDISDSDAKKEVLATPKKASKKEALATPKKAAKKGSSHIQKSAKKALATPPKKQHQKLKP